MLPLANPASVASALIGLTLVSPASRTFLATCWMANGCGSMAYTRPSSPTNSAVGMVKNPVPQPTSKTSCPDWILALFKVLTGSKNRRRNRLSITGAINLNRK
jgi:hypothetical protein